jgi:hypothetical protein
MNIPLDRLYQYIENIAQEIYGNSVIIYRFWPHGSKNINNLVPLCNDHFRWYEKHISPAVWCNDQEPLNYEFYNNHDKIYDNLWLSIVKSFNLCYTAKNLNHQPSIFEKGLLLHSEKRSKNLKKYQLDNELIPVYYWSHAVIARDWFRYAKHTSFQKCIKKTFLCFLYFFLFSPIIDFPLSIPIIFSGFNTAHSIAKSAVPVATSKIIFGFLSARSLTHFLRQPF